MTTLSTVRPMTGSPGRASADRACSALVDDCCRELTQRGVNPVPRCLVHDLAAAALDPSAPVPPMECDESQSEYWKHVDRLIRHPKWRRCLGLICPGVPRRWPDRVAVLILGLLGVPGCPSPARAARRSTEITNRAGLDISGLLPSPLAELMTAVTVVPGGDHRMIDLVAVALYEAGVQLDIPPRSLLAAALRQIRHLAVGQRKGDSRVPAGGFYGITTRGDDLADVLPSELADRRMFLAKYARGELLYWRRSSPSDEDPYVRFGLHIDTGGPGLPDGPDGHRFISRAKALALWVCHDLTWNIVRATMGLRYLFEFTVEDGAADPPPVTFRFRLPQALLDFAGELAVDKPLLEQVEALLPFFLRTRIPVRTVPAHREDADDTSRRLPRRPRDLRESGVERVPPVSETMPVFAYDVTIAAGGDLDTRMRRLRRGATFSLTENDCTLHSRRLSSRPTVPFDVNRIYELRRLLLELVLDEMLTVLTDR